MAWSVEYTSKAKKGLKKLPENIRDSALALVFLIEEDGPNQYKWPNFSKLSKTTFHCHLKKGSPTYVVCWRVLNKKEKLIEVYYVGTHEKAPY